MDKIIGRIKKLLASASDTASPYEAATAARQARKLMDKHQLSMKDLVESDGFDEALTGKSRKYVAMWEQGIAINVAEYNDCVVSFQSNNGYKKMVFKGFSSDVVVCKYMFGYLVENGKRLCSKHMRDKGYTRYNAAVGTTFKQAYGRIIGDKIQELLKERQEEMSQSTGTSLMVIKSQLVEKRFGEISYGKRSVTYRTGGEFDDATQAGREAGRNTSIHTGVDNTVRREISTKY